MNEKAKYTPGPWTIDKRGFIRDPLGDLIRALGIGFPGRGNTTDEHRANARLIVAAPEMVELLRHARECVVYCRRNHDDAQKGEGIPFEFLIDALLAKIDGEG